MTATIPLGRVIDIAKGKKPAEVSRVPREGFVQHLQIADLRRERTAEFVPARGATLATTDDVLICWDGSKAGTSASGLAGAAGSTIAVLRLKQPTLKTRYVAWFIKANYDRLNAAAVGAAVPHVDRRVLESLELPLCSEDDQERIADILDKADDIRRKHKEAIALTEELLRSTFMDMVGPGAEDYSRWSRESIQSLAARTPNAMRTGPFGSDLLHSEFVDDGIAVLGIDNAVQNVFTWGERRFITPEKYEKLRRYSVYPGDVIVTIMGTTGRSAVVPDDIPLAITTKHLATITLDRDKAEPEFVSQALFRHPEVLQQIASANRGAIMSGLNLGLIKSLRVPIPPIRKQREFANVTRYIRALAARMQNRDETEMLFTALAQRAFSVMKASAGTLC